MEITIPDIPEGRYIVGVSGGIDSVVLLHLLLLQEAELIVVHVDHGIRPDSARDAEFTENLAHKYELPFELYHANLGAGASEDAARQARYRFLHDVQQKHEANAIILAHHQDDVLETMLINLIRGTGWRGLCSLKSRPGILRPLISVPRAEILDYAIENGLEWIEDETNFDPRYLRNEVRMSLVPKLTISQRKKLISIYESQVVLAQKIDKESARLLDEWSLNQDSCTSLPRYQLVMADHAVAIEIIQSCVRGKTGQSLEYKQAETCLLFAKTAQPGRIHIPRQGIKLTSGPHEITIED